MIAPKLVNFTRIDMLSTPIMPPRHEMPKLAQLLPPDLIEKITANGQVSYITLNKAKISYLQMIGRQENKLYILMIMLVVSIITGFILANTKAYDEQKVPDILKVIFSLDIAIVLAACCIGCTLFSNSQIYNILEALQGGEQIDTQRLADRENGEQNSGTGYSRLT
jgi:hypothetical protein